ncbi:DUF1643 domain-containing protein [Myxococcus xanthus]|uniref:DUF1643 domain-containing protein n=1 Tax=Myxococcus xanthus TaxID=34 RepID=UPI001917A0E3|nr:DUF1643 domain-containing protein [Myxococcus xanthus]QQR47710.1 DUF1643 domain-containing protein [Myxococcus xanthus]
MSCRYLDAGALLSACGTYRYSLWREWDQVAAPRVALWLMTNPSDADGETDDNTVARCVRFSQAWGCTGLVIGNPRAFRTPYPKELAARTAEGVDTIGPANEAVLSALLSAPETAVVIAAWGNHSNNVGRVEGVVALARTVGRQLHCLGLTGDGSPKHPLARGKSFVPYSQQPIPFEPVRIEARP